FTFARLRVHLLTAVIAIGSTSIANAAERNFSIPEQSLDSALRMFGLQAGEPVVFSAADVRGYNSTEINGRYAVDDALKRLMSGTPLRALRTGRQTILIRTSSRARSAIVNP